MDGTELCFLSATDLVARYQTRELSPVEVVAAVLEQIAGRRWADPTVLRAAAAFEQAAPWTGRRPEVI